MTLPPSKIGDKGQRYFIEALGYPEEGWAPIGYSSKLDVAQAMADAIALAPGCKQTRITDRNPERSRR